MGLTAIHHSNCQYQVDKMHTFLLGWSERIQIYTSIFQIWASTSSIYQIIVPNYKDCFKISELVIFWDMSVKLSMSNKPVVTQFSYREKRMSALPYIVHRQQSLAREMWIVLSFSLLSRQMIVQILLCLEYLIISIQCVKLQLQLFYSFFFHLTRHCKFPCIYSSKKYIRWKLFLWELSLSDIFTFYI